jgi:hypothetical protein
LADLSSQRWGVETELSAVKTTRGRDVLPCTTEAGVLTELARFAIVDNLVRLVLWEASRRQGGPRNRISFVDALRWWSSSPPGPTLPDLVVNPQRPGRVEPRCQQRHAKKYPSLICPRRVLRQRLLFHQVPA